MTPSPHGLYDQGYTRATMAGTEGRGVARRGLSLKTCLSAGWNVQLDSVRSGSLVMADLHAAVNTYPWLVHAARLTIRVS